MMSSISQAFLALDDGIEHAVNQDAMALKG